MFWPLVTFAFVTLSLWQDGLFFEFVWDESLELQQRHVQGLVRMGASIVRICLYQCVFVRCVSVCVFQAALEKALSCVALEVPSGAGRPAGLQTCCLAPVPPQGLTIVLPLTAFVLFSLPIPPLSPPTPPPSPPVCCPAGAADPWPREGGSVALETIEDLSSYLYINSLCYLCLFGGFDISLYNFVIRLDCKTPCVSIETCSACCDQQDYGIPPLTWG